MYKQADPYCVQVEMTEGCNLYCTFCGLRGIREKKVKNFKFLTLPVANKIAKGIADAGWNSRIEFAMHGEPTMNPDAMKILRIFRLYLPNNQLMMTSNGGGLLKNSLFQIGGYFDVGLNVLAIDWYQDVGIGDKLWDLVNKDERAWSIHLYPDDLSASPHKRWKKGTKAMVFIKDISTQDTGNHAHLVNHCGAAGPLDYSKDGMRCVKPFREVSVRWDGKIAACCEDWRGIYKCGDVKKTPIEEIWHGKEFNSLRKHLYHGIRDQSPCLGCNRTGYRLGLLPDPKGKESLPRPTRRDRQIFEGAIRGRGLTVTIKREWE